MSTEITSEFVWHNIPPRPRDSHKGSFGTVLAVAGSAYYRGAALLATEGALRTGAGIVTLASVEPVLAAAVARLPECCLCPCVAGAEGGISPESIPQLQRQKATVLLLGPGLGGTAQSAARAAETRTLVQKLLPGFAGSAVLDAEQHYTVCHYMRCRSCGALYFVGACIRGAPVFRQVADIRKENLDTRLWGRCGTYYLQKKD